MDNLESRLNQLESEAQHLRDEIGKLRADWEQQTTVRQSDEHAQLRQAVLRYAVACAAVDVQVALLRARGETNKEAIEHLQKCTDEQTEASNALRALARHLQNELPVPSFVKQTAGSGHPDGQAAEDEGPRGEPEVLAGDVALQADALDGFNFAHPAL